MSPQSIETRLEKLEQRVTVLEQLPARIDGLTLQIVQLREEMHMAISASEASLEASLRAEVRSGDDALRREFQNGFQQLKAEMHLLRDDVMGQARTLYEDMKTTLALIKEALPPPRKRRQIE